MCPTGASVPLRTTVTYFSVEIWKVVVANDVTSLGDSWLTFLFIFNSQMIKPGGQVEGYDTSHHGFAKLACPCLHLSPWVFLEGEVLFHSFKNVPWEEKRVKMREVLANILGFKKQAAKGRQKGRGVRSAQLYSELTAEHLFSQSASYYE